MSDFIITPCIISPPVHNSPVPHSAYKPIKKALWIAFKPRDLYRGLQYKILSRIFSLIDLATTQH